MISFCAFRWFGRNFGGAVKKILSVSQWIRLQVFANAASFRQSPQNAHDGTFFHRPASEERF